MLFANIPSGCDCWFLLSLLFGYCFEQLKQEYLAGADDEDDETPLAKRAKNLPRAVIPRYFSEYQNQ